MSPAFALLLAEMCYAGLVNRYQQTIGIDTLGVVNDPIGAHVAANTAAYQAALNTYAGSVRLVQSANLTVILNASLNVPSNTTLQIDGVLKAETTGSTIQSVLNPSNASGILLEGQGVIDAQNVAISCFGPANLSNSVIRGLTLQNSVNWNINVIQSFRVYAIGCTFINGNSSNEFAAGCVDCWFIGCIVPTGTLGDLTLGFYGNCATCGAIGCLLWNCNNVGIFVLNDADQPGLCTDILIDNNRLVECALAAIFIGSNLTGSGNHTNITISNNITCGGKNGGIQLNFASQVKVYNNRSYGNTLSGNQGDIAVYANVQFCSIKDNLIFDTAGFGIHIDEGNSVEICDNTLHESRVPAVMLGAFGGTTLQYCLTYNNNLGTFAGAADQITYDATSLVFSENQLFVPESTTQQVSLPGSVSSFLKQYPSTSSIGKLIVSSNDQQGLVTLPPGITTYTTQFSPAFTDQPIIFCWISQLGVQLSYIATLTSLQVSVPSNPTGCTITWVALSPINA
jgi:hypothetical protein